MISMGRRQSVPVPIDRICELLTYNSQTGVFRWRSDMMRGGVWHKAGDVAGFKGKTCCRIGVDGRSYNAHRLAWAMHYKEQPPPIIDHINGDPHDNRIANLRPATVAENARNSKKPCTNKSGFKGVHYHDDKRSHGQVKKWRAYIKVNGAPKYLGAYKTPEEASEAYLRAAALYHGDFARP